jgi:hypothetical protein
MPASIGLVRAGGLSEEATTVRIKSLLTGQAIQASEKETGASAVRSARLSGTQLPVAVKLFEHIEKQGQL